MFWVMVVTGALAACQAADGPTGGEPTTAAPDASFAAGLAFSADVVAEADRVRVSYRLRNSGPSPVVALNGVPATDTIQDPPVDRAAVYVTPRGDGTVELAKRAFPLPAGVGVAAPFQLAGTVVAPGDETAEEFTVPLPLRGRDPYGDAAGGSGNRLPDPVTRVVFCLGVLPANMIDMRRDGTAERPVYGHMDFTAAAQHLLCSQPVPLPG